MFDLKPHYSGPRDHLAKRPLHRTMTALNSPLRRPTWQLIVLAALLCILAGFIWYVAQRNLLQATAVALSLGVFFLADIVTLSMLPRRRISFAPWKAQFLFLALPRTFAALAIGVLSLWLEQTWAWWIYLVAQLMGTLLLIWGAHIEAASLQLTNLDIPIQALPAGAQPVRLLHVSDLHIERLSRREDTLLRLVEASNPDIILITGDYVNLSFNRDPETYRHTQLLLSKLAARHGVYAVLGTPTVDLQEFVTPLFEDVDVTLLRDQWLEIDLVDGRSVTLLGLDCTHDDEADGDRLRVLSSLAPNHAPRVLLYHSPDLIPLTSELGIDLYLCGHTHGGQVRLPVIGPLLTSSTLGRRYVMGQYRDGKTNLYVSRGVGLEGLSAPRTRLLTPPEITLVTLRPP